MEICKLSEEQKCPACNAIFTSTLTNWFVIDLIKNTTYDIDNPYMEVLLHELQKIQTEVNGFSRTVLKIDKENEEQTNKIKSRIDRKVREAQVQLDSIEYNLSCELQALKNKHEKTLNDGKKFDSEFKEKLKTWHKKLNSNEYRRNNSNLQSIQNEIEVETKLIGGKKIHLESFVDINDKFYFEENLVKFKSDMLGMFKESKELDWRLKLMKNGSLMLFTSLMYIIYGLLFLIGGTFNVLFGFVLCIFMGCNKEFGSLKFIKKLHFEIKKIYYDYFTNRRDKCFKSVKNS